MRLENYCIMKERDLLKFLSNKKGAVFKNDYVYIDRGAKVLAVCHADVSPTVKKFRDFVAFKSRSGQSVAYSPALDDRLGIWLVMEILKDLKMDVLITTGEETGNTSASNFIPNKDYNWLTEFDRRGADVVTYDYYNEEMMIELKDVGFKLGIGSFSDISMMDHLGVAAFNVGIGYHQEHSRGCWANLDETDKQINRFRKFYFRNYEVEFLDEASGWIDNVEEWFGSSEDKWLESIQSDEDYLAKFRINRDSSDIYATNRVRKGKFLKVGC